MDVTPGPEIYAAVDENALRFVREFTGDPDAMPSPLSIVREHDVAELVYPLAYQAGREDAARDLEAEADDEAQRPGRAEPSELIERWLREAARIARGIGRFDEVEDSSMGTEEAPDG